MTGILLILSHGSCSLMLQGWRTIKGYCLLEYTSLTTGHIWKLRQKPPCSESLQNLNRSGLFTQHLHHLGFLSWPLYSDPSVCHLPGRLRWTAALLSTKYTFSSCIPFSRLRTSAAPSMAKPTILAGHKAALFPIPKQSIHIFIHMPSICTPAVMLSPGSSVNDPFLIKS